MAFSVNADNYINVKSHAFIITCRVFHLKYHRRFNSQKREQKSFFKIRHATGPFISHTMLQLCLSY